MFDCRNELNVLTSVQFINKRKMIHVFNLLNGLFVVKGFIDQRGVS